MGINQSISPAALSFDRLEEGAGEGAASEEDEAGTSRSISINPLPPWCLSSERVGKTRVGEEEEKEEEAVACSFVEKTRVHARVNGASERRELRVP